MRRIPRRQFLSVSAAAAAALPVIGRARIEAAQNTDRAFRHGVASGDPLLDRVVLWTRVSASGDAVPVRWTIALDPKLARVVSRGEAQTGAERDYTVKVDVDGLEPGTTYYYRFEAARGQSPIGRTRTLPASSVARIRLGVVSCSNYPFGYFNAYAGLANRPDLDAVLHLGDYIYEYQNGRFGDGSRIGRIPIPDAEILALADYRARHAQYKADPDSQAVHRQHPFLVVWDDHELANNAWSGGAENHNPDKGEGSWESRRRAAVRAYFEWMPIREMAASPGPRIYRTLRWGDLADLVLLDTRLIGRDQQADRRDDIATLESPSRSILGAVQEEWLGSELRESRRSGTRWQVLGQQVMFAPQSPAGRPTSNADSWDGYRTSRNHVFDMIGALKIESFAVLTGDVHSSWAFDLPRNPFDGYDAATGRGSVGIEFAGTSVTSSSPIGSGPDGERQLAAIKTARPHLHYVDGRYRGYYLVDITRERFQAEFYAMKTVLDRTADERFVTAFAAPAGQMRLTQQATPAPAPPAPDPAP